MTLSEFFALPKAEQEETWARIMPEVWKKMDETMADFPFRKLSDPQMIPTEGQLRIRGDLLKQMDSLRVAGVIHLTEDNGRQYFVIRLPDTH